jgi:hypothetical protein
MRREPPADLDERIHEIDAEAVPRLQRPSHIDVVVRVGIGRVRMQPEQDCSDEQGKRK